MNRIYKEVLDILDKAAKGAGIDAVNAVLDYPTSSEHGDFSSNIAMASSKKLGMPAKEIADKIVAGIKADMNAGVEDYPLEEVSAAGPGFINFKVKDRRFMEEVSQIAKSGSHISASRKGEKVMVEYTDPNIFKAFHIGHLMSNAIGESISRLIESSGATVIRLCYPSDAGLHIAKSIWALQKHSSEMPPESAPISERTDFLGKMYVEGTKAYESDDSAKDDIDALNKVIYEKSSKEVNSLYEKGRKWSLDHFDELYKLLGTKFDGYIYESEMAPVGMELVRSNTKPKGAGIFEESDGAIVFKGEEHGLHTRVFINSQGLPTYEAKEVGLNLTKFKNHSDADESIIVTASEQNDYFKVLAKVISLMDPKDGNKLRHIGHGMMRFASGKMSSRTGNVITAESLISDMRRMVHDKIAERDSELGKEIGEDELGRIADIVAVGAIKYTILRSSVGSDIIFDSTASISFEGDSGPYLQYSAVRAQAVLDKAAALKIDDGDVKTLPQSAGELERLISRFPVIAERAIKEIAPQHIAGYLTALAGTFNGFYAVQVIVDENDPLSPYHVSLTRAFRKVMESGLQMLGIGIPPKM